MGYCRPSLRDEEAQILAALDILVRLPVGRFRESVVLWRRAGFQPGLIKSYWPPGTKDMITPPCCDCIGSKEDFSATSVYPKMMLMKSKHLALVLLGCATLAAVADTATNAPRRSPVTNLAEWKDGVPAALPAVRHPKVEGVYLYRPESQWTYSHHPSLTFFQGRFFAIWSNGRTNEDDLGQRVLLSTSEDFDHWTEPRPLADSIRDAKGAERVLTAAGFHQWQGTLVAYFGNYGLHKEGTRLQAMTTTNGQTWSAIREIGVPVNPNHGPQATRSGRLIIAGNISFPWSDDRSGLSGWQMSGIYPASMNSTIKDDPASFREVATWQDWAAALCEGSFYQTDDNTLQMLLRNAGQRKGPLGHRLWITESRDDGVTWSEPIETDFSDTNAKFHFGRLPNGRFYYVGNPIGQGRTPLVLSLSRDGVRFGEHFILGDEHYSQRRPGHAKGGEYGYPTSLIHDGWLYVIVSRQKEAVQVLRVRLAQLGS